jgi:tetratricopeptide (TPR) repeat protein
MGDRATALQLCNAAVASVNDKSNPKGANNGFQLFSSACYADPTYHLPFYQAGNNDSDLSLVEAAVACYRRALECDILDRHERAKTMTNLGWGLHRMGEEHEALEWSQKAVDLDPTLAYAWMNMSLIHGVLGQQAASVACADRAYALEPGNAIVGMVAAFAYLFDGQYRKGLEFFEARFPYKLTNFLLYPYPKWRGERDKTVFLVADQGLGDTLSYSRFVETAAKRCRYLHVSIPSELLRLFNHAFAHLENVNVLPQAGVSFPQADAWTTFVSLPFALGLSDEEIKSQPGIAYPSYTVPNNWKVPDRALHVGIAWAGSPANDINKYRSIPVERFLELYRVPGVQLYSLQVGERAKDLHDVGAAPVIRDLSGYLVDVVCTMDILRDLDLVVCCESALGHIAGLAGVECWIPYSYAGRDYRLGPRGDRILWYRKHRTFNQGPTQDWRSVFQEIVRALRKRVRAAKKQEAAE